MRRLRSFLVLFFFLLLRNGTCVNLLTGHEYAVDKLYREEGASGFRGEMRGVAWNPSQRGLGLVPDESGAWYCAKNGMTARGSIVEGTYFSQPVTAEFDFHEVCPSWNIRLDERVDGYRVFIRVASRDRRWSPWFYLGGAGISLDARQPTKTLKSDSWGLVDIDYMLLKRPASYLQYKVVLQSSRRTSRLAQQGPVLQRFFLSYSNTAGNRDLWEKRRVALQTVPDGWMTTLSVPYRSQLWVEEQHLRLQICCPTCVAMVLQSYGTDLPTTVVASQCLDREYDIYGTWPRASQAASMHGLEAWVQRFRTDDDVKRMIAQGLPVVASIRANKGELTNSTYTEVAGHLILLIGFTSNGDYIVNDPYAPGDGGGQRVYKKEDIARIWFDKGGVGIVIRKPDVKGDK